MRNLAATVWLTLAVAAGALAEPASAQGPGAAPPPATSAAGNDLSVLRGRWVRPDGGYVIDIKSVGANGKLDASYANPALLPFYTAEASRDGKMIKLFFELRAGGYGGSTYTLVYDPANDRLHGVYFQAVAKQKFDVVFARARP